MKSYNIGSKIKEYREATGLTLHELRHTYIIYSRSKTDIDFADLRSYMDTQKI